MEGDGGAGEEGVEGRAGEIGFASCSDQDRINFMSTQYGVKRIVGVRWCESEGICSGEKMAAAGPTNYRIEDLLRIANTNRGISHQ